jgi:hypothetical protein
MSWPKSHAKLDYLAVEASCHVTNGKVGNIPRFSPGWWRDLQTLRVLVALLILVSAGLMTAGRWMRGPAEAYVWLGTQLLHGDVSPKVYDDDIVTAEIQRLTSGRVRDIVSPSPPTLALFTAPFAYPRLATAEWTWVTLDVLATLVSLLVVFRAVGWPRESLPLALLLSTVLLVSTPLQENLLRGQVYLVVLLWVTLSTWGYATSRDWLVGCGLALALTMKVVGAPLWLLLAFEGRWKALAWAAALTLILVVGSLKWIPVITYSRWMFEVIPAWLVTPKMMVPAYQTVTGFIQHLLRFDAEWNPSPLANLPIVATVSVALVSAGLLAITLRASRHTCAPSLPVFAAATILSIVLQPTAEQYAYITAFVPFVVATREWLRRRSYTSGVCVTVALVLVYSPLPFKNPLLWQGTIALLAYPRLFGGLALWGTLILQAESSGAREVSDIPENGGACKNSPPEVPQSSVGTWLGKLRLSLVN